MPNKKQSKTKQSRTRKPQSSKFRSLLGGRSFNFMVYMSVFAALGVGYLVITHAYTLSDNRGLAGQMLGNSKITYWTTSNGSTREIVDAIAKTGAAYTTCPSITRRSTNVDVNMMRFLVDAGNRGSLMVNAITDKCHTNGSLHYLGRAVDIQSSGRNSELVSLAKNYGGSATYESGHIHISFAGTYPNGTTTQTQTSSPAPSGTPIGHVDGVNCRYVRGWTFDPDNKGASIQVHVYNNATYERGGRDAINGGATNVSRPDVNQAYRISGTHGFDIQLPEAWRDGRDHTLYVYGINTYGGGVHFMQAVRMVGCANPMGNIDGGDCSTIRGWALDMNEVNRNLNYHVYVDGGPGGSYAYGDSRGIANVSRPDVNNYFKDWHIGTGNHGIVWTIPSSLKNGRSHTYNFYGINVGSGTTNPLIGSKTLTCSR